MAMQDQSEDQQEVNKQLYETRLKIDKLCKMAEPLRDLEDDDPRKHSLTNIVDQINNLRRKEQQLMSGYIERGIPKPSMAVMPVEDDISGMSMNQIKRAKR